MSRYSATVTKVWHVEVDVEDSLAVAVAALEAVREGGDCTMVRIQDVAPVTS